jgi:dienelactone hydrolase
MNQPTQPRYAHLGPFSDFVDVARALKPLFPAPASGEETRKSAREILGFTFNGERPGEPRVERSWQADGVDGEEISWSVGYGPRAHAWILKPTGTRGPLPGIVALHDHGHYKLSGKEKIADGSAGPLPALELFRRTYYGGRAYANELARKGFIVLVPDAFLFGSRKFPLDVMPDVDRQLAKAVEAALGPEISSAAAGSYNGAAFMNEHVVSKYCTLLGTNLASVVAYEDRVALNYLRGRPDVDPDRIACIGLSGGGLRAALMRATSDDFKGCVIVGMMCTYEDLLDNCVAPHTWMFFPAGLSLRGDWPDLAACAAPAPLLVQYALGDPLFKVAGMRGADARIAGHYQRVGARDAYRGAFYEGPHRFDIAMQDDAIAWLRTALRA